MLSKQYQLANKFEFYNKPELKPKKSFKKIIGLSIFSFFALQGVFIYTNHERVQNSIAQREEEQNKIYHIYSNLKQSIHQSNQEDIIANFSKIKYSNLPIADLLVGGELMLIKLEHQKNNKKNVTSDTLNKLTDIYLNNWNSGIVEDKNKIDNIKCSTIDLVCHKNKPALQLVLKADLKSVENKIIATHYNIQNINEFVTWNKKFHEQIAKNNYSYVADPGVSYVNNLP